MKKKLTKKNLKRPPPIKKNPTGFFSNLFRSYELVNGYYLLFNKDYGSFIIAKFEKHIYIYDNIKRRFKLYDDYPSSELNKQLRAGSIFIDPITDRKLIEHFNIVRSMGLAV